jgi:hypothetical protein
MGNCFGSPATIQSEPQPRPLVIELRSSASAPLPPSRPRSHSSLAVSEHESGHHRGRSSQDPTPCSRIKSAPQPPQTFKSPFPQDPKTKARSVVQSKRSSRSDFRPTGPGENIFENGPRVFIDLLKRASNVRSPFTDYELR